MTLPLVTASLSLGQGACFLLQYGFDSTTEPLLDILHPKKDFSTDLQVGDFAVGAIVPDGPWPERIALAEGFKIEEGA